MKSFFKIPLDLNLIEFHNLNFPLLHDPLLYSQLRAQVFCSFELISRAIIKMLENRGPKPNYFAQTFWMPIHFKMANTHIFLNTQSFYL